MPLGANTNTIKENRTEPNQEKQKILHKKKVFTTLSKIYPTKKVLESKT